MIQDQETDLKDDSFLQKGKEIKLPKLNCGLNRYHDTSVNTTYPDTVRGETLQIEVPQLDYRKYRGYHIEKKNAYSGRCESDSPRCNLYYVPQVIRVSPRSKIKIFTNFPIYENSQKKVKRKKISKVFGNQGKMFLGSGLRNNRPEKKNKPAMTYGEKLWKLHELACMDFKGRLQF